MRRVAILGLMMIAAPAAHAAVIASGWNWSPPRESWCAVTLTAIEEDHPADQLRLALRNDGNTRLALRLRVRAEQGGHRMDSVADYDNINPGETRKADTDAVFAGTVVGSRVSVSVTSCEERF